jgi:hypothetical protein
VIDVVIGTPVTAGATCPPMGWRDALGSGPTDPPLYWGDPV